MNTVIELMNALFVRIVFNIDLYELKDCFCNFFYNLIIVEIQNAFNTMSNIFYVYLVIGL